MLDGTADSSVGADYNAVNSALNEYFFRGRYELQPVYLNLEGEVEAAIAERLQVSPDVLGEHIGSCVAASLRFDLADPYFDHANLLKDWSRAGRREPPPFTALLLALSTAAEKMRGDENVSANNYYARLFDIFGITHANYKSKLKQKAKSTWQFWRALNFWLSENDFMLGRPTARALIKHWKYASFALSQALIREADRARFPALFDSYDLTPGDPITEAEMTVLIHNWMPAQGPSGPTTLLRKLWAVNDLKPRVIAAALDAFDSWEGLTTASEHSSANARLQWQIGFTEFPLKKAMLALMVPRSGRSEFLKLEHSTDEQLHLRLRLEEVESGVHILGPLESLDLGHLLLQSRRYTGMESGVSYEYIAKPIIPLVRSTVGQTYREVSRVSLFEEHIVLCHESWLTRVTDHLSLCARPRYEVWQSADRHGIPNGWCILRGIQIVRRVDEADENLHALNPINSPVAIACVDGLKLGASIWHADAPPAIQVNSEKPGCKLRIITERFSESDETLISQETQADFIEVVPSADEFTAGEHFRAVAEVKGGQTAEISFSLRCADVPRPLGKRRFRHLISVGGRFEFAVGEVDIGDQAGLEGCVIHGEIGISDLTAVDVGNISDVPAGSPESAPEMEWGSFHQATQEASESCVIRGHHVWYIEPFEKGDLRFEAKSAECKDCHAKTRFFAMRTGGRQRNRQVLTHGMRDGNRSVAPVTLPAHDVGRHAATISLDTVFDSLCYLGEGSWGTFQRLASVALPDFWRSHSFASDLFALGHLEARGAFGFTMCDWSVPPPVIVIGSGGMGRLAGFHSNNLLKEIREALEKAGGHYCPASMVDTVTVHRWTSLEGLNLEALLDGVQDPYGRQVAVSRDLGQVIASRLPSINEAWKHGLPVHVETVEALARFDVHQSSWVRSENLNEPGAYRVGLHGTRYVFHNSEGATRQVGYRVAKILAARAENARLHTFDTSTGKFVAALGVEPPGLFARALVASCGSLPAIQQRRLVYENVESSVGTLVLNKLYEGAHV